ncbi:MAG: peptide-methionine (R)-S-oxide reductase MsrB [Candidatus Andersenbacteria bacterium]
MNTPSTPRIPSKAELKKKLSPEAYAVTQHKATEAPFSGKYVHTNEAGMYVCAVCGTPLFSSKTKFSSGTGWPSFYKPTSEDNVVLREDTSGGMRRTEVICKTCGAHLGHVFDDAPDQPSGKRFCINSCALELKPESQSNQSGQSDGATPRPAKG